MGGGGGQIRKGDSRKNPNTNKQVAGQLFGTGEYFILIDWKENMLNINVFIV